VARLCHVLEKVYCTRKPPVPASGKTALTTAILST
jgi:hypothetical protein